MSFEITGTLHKKFDTETKSEKFSTRVFVLDVPGKYPNLIKFQLLNDRTDLVDRIFPGDEITVHFDIRGREWQGKYFTSLDAWRVQIKAGTIERPKADNEPVKESPYDDLPF